MGVDQLAQQHRLLDGREGPRHRARQHLRQRLAQRVIPALHQCRVAPQSRERRHAPVAVDEHQRSTAGLGRGDAGHPLPVLLYRMGQSVHGRPVHDARTRKAQLQAVQIDLRRRPLPKRARAHLHDAWWRHSGAFKVIGHA